MAKVSTEADATYFINMNKVQFAQIALTGALIGVLTWGLTWLLDVYIYQPILCRMSEGVCVAAPTYALVTANLLAAIAGLFALVRLQVFRPLLIVLAVLLSLWSLPLIIGAFAWYWALLAVAVISAAAYAAFSWIVRVRSFALALIVAIVMIVAVRFIMYS